MLIHYCAVKFFINSLGLLEWLRSFRSRFKIEMRCQAGLKCKFGVILSLVSAYMSLLLNIQIQMKLKLEDGGAPGK